MPDPLKRQPYLFKEIAKAHGKIEKPDLNAISWGGDSGSGDSWSWNIWAGDWVAKAKSLGE